MESPDAVVKTAGWPRRLAATARSAASALLDQLYPPLCLACETPVASPDGLCPKCFSELRFITAPLCPRLGIPFEVSLGPDALSAEAIADPPPFDRARAAVLYNAVARALVSRMKYGDRPELARFCGSLMARAGHVLWADKPVLVPIPLHPLRHLQRRYNQSAELARVIGAVTGLPCDSAILRRSKRTRQQVGLTADARHRNVSGAFSATGDALVRLRGRRVVLVDDVVTTGATVKAATRALHKAGIDKVDVISFARVVPGEHLP